MAKQYSPAGQDAARRIERLKAELHPELKGVTVCSLFVFDDEPGPVLEHQGYPAAAVIKITSTRERAAGMADALVVFDRYVYEGLTEPQRDAMVDHELYHAFVFCAIVGPTAAQDVEPRASAFDRIDPQEYPWLLWLESRIHFPRTSPDGDPGPVVVVGHSALKAAVRSVGALIEENERLRAVIASRAPPDPVLGDAWLLDMNCFYEKLKDRALSGADVMGACRVYYLLGTTEKPQ